MFGKTISFALLAGFLAGAGARAIAADPQGIGRIVSVDKKYWGMRISGGGSDRDAEANGEIFEGDAIQTIANQHIAVLMDEGSELFIGPSSRVIFKNWNGRNSENHCVRTIRLERGMVKAKVRKIYSQDEPFVLDNKNGVVAVRGTEFVVEAGQGGRLDTIRTLSAREKELRRHEVEVHTLEGEVHFARDLAALSDPSTRVSVFAGQTSLVRDTMARPQTSHSFDSAKFAAYFSKAAPGVKLTINKGATNEGRAETAMNSTSSAKDVSPARPGYAQARQTRMIASLATNPKTSTGVDSHKRRKELGLEKADLRQAEALADSNGKRTPTTDGVHQLGEGQEQLDSQARNLPEAMGQRNGAQLADQYDRAPTPGSGPKRPDTSPPTTTVGGFHLPKLGGGGP